MGRTIPSYRIILEEELKRWERFRDFLRIDEREVFQDLMDECRRCASAAGAGSFPSKTEGMFLSILRERIEHINNLLEKGVSKTASQHYPAEPQTSR